MVEILPTGLFIFGLSLFLDLLELSFGRILWFVRTLRFWLYFILHVGMSCLAAYLIHSKVNEWYLLAPVGTFLGVGVISNTNVRIGGQSLVPIADLFQSIRAKMFEQAGTDKAEQTNRAALAARLRNLQVAQLENVYRDILAARGKAELAEDRIRDARSGASPDSLKTKLISYILKADSTYVAQDIDKWDPPVAPRA